MGNQLRKNLGVEFGLQGNLDFAQYLPLGDAEGLHRAVPARLEHGLPGRGELPGAAVLHSARAGGFELHVLRNPEFDELIAKGDAAATDDDGDQATTRRREDILLEDMPVMPLFFTDPDRLRSDKVNNVEIDMFGRVDVCQRSPSTLRLPTRTTRRGAPAATEQVPRRSSAAAARSAPHGNGWTSAHDRDPSHRRDTTDERRGSWAATSSAGYC